MCRLVLLNAPFSNRKSYTYSIIVSLYVFQCFEKIASIMFLAKLLRAFECSFTHPFSFFRMVVKIKNSIGKIGYNSIIVIVNNSCNSFTYFGNTSTSGSN